MNQKISNIFKWLFVIIIVFITFFTTIIVYWYYRPNTSYVNDDLKIDCWDAVADGKHNSNTDMILWNDTFYLIYASSPFHWGTSESKLVIRKSINTKDWIKVTELDFGNLDDIRDPKFALINGTLFVYALANQPPIADPYKTVYAISNNGVDWSNWLDLKGDDIEGWLFWRPKTYDNNTWYCPAYWHEHGKSALFKSTDGITWEKVSEIYKGETNDETAIEFYEDGTILSTARLEGVSEYMIIGDVNGGTLLATSKAPYKEWNYEKSKITRLDGPRLFRYNNKIYAVGRFEPEAKGLFTNTGSFFNKKRTSLFLIDNNEITYLSDLPSTGDTSYAGIVMKDGYLYISYYTSDTNYDYTWILGQIAPSNIKIAKIKLSNLEKVAENPPSLPEKSLIKIDMIIFATGLLCEGYITFIAIKRYKL
ncbi:MAG: sialidase family protein [Promethearchaeota archaeon]